MKRFLAVIVTVCTPAVAGVILGSGSCAVTTTNSLPSEGACFVAVSPAAGQNADLNYYSVSGTNTASNNAGGLYSILYTAQGAIVQGSTFGAGDYVPVNWDFTVTSSVANPISYALYYSLGSYDHVAISDTVASGTRVQGSGLFGGIGGLGDHWSVTLSVSLYNNSQSNLESVTLTVPGNSTLDFNLPGSEPQTPEPASMLLGASGLGFALFLRRRK